MHRSFRSRVLALALSQLATNQTYQFKPSPAAGYRRTFQQRRPALGVVTGSPSITTGNVFMALPDYAAVVKMDSARHALALLPRGDGGEAARPWTKSQPGNAQPTRNATRNSNGNSRSRWSLHRWWFSNRRRHSRTVAEGLSW
jgi:hypothetical protein